MVQKKEFYREKIIAKLLVEHRGNLDRDEILASIVTAWCVSNNYRLQNLEIYPNLLNIISAPIESNLHSDLTNALGPLTIKDVEAAFENTIDIQRKRSEGAVYTPNFVIDYLINRCLSTRTTKILPHLIDPACGSGGFLVRAIPLLADYYQTTKEHIVRDYIHGVDVNSDAIQCATLILELFCVENNIKTTDISSIFRCRDTLLSTKEILTSEFSVNQEGFDIVVTNPPYVKIQNISEEYKDSLTKRYPEFTFGSYSLAMLFLIAGHRLLNSEGITGLITQNNLLNSVSGEGVRDYLQKNKSIHTLIDFGHQKIFSNASAYTCLVFLDNKPKESFKHTICHDAKNQLEQLSDSELHEIKLDTLSKKKWRLASPKHLLNLKKLESIGTPLGLYAEIRVGFATLKDSVFLIDDSSLYQDIENEITFPAIKIANFSNEDELKQNRMRIIRPYYKSGKKWLAYEEKEFMARFPYAYAYLKSREEELRTRDKGKISPSKFFEWGRVQGMEALGPKLLTKTFNKRPNFILDETDSLFCNGYSIKPKAANNLFCVDKNIYALQQILNSRVMDYYSRLTSFQIEGNYQCYQKNFIERFSIPDISPVHIETLKELEGEALQTFICTLFDLDSNEILEIVRD